MSIPAPDRGPALLRVALAQVDATVGDLAGNAGRVLAASDRAARAGAHLVAFPEMMLTGYPVEDLTLRPAFRAASRATLDTVARRLAERGLGELAVVVGYVDDDGLPRNAAAFLLGGRVVARYFKHFLPNYSVFDERRYFAAGDRLAVVRHLGVDIALTICEDLWRDGDGPITAAARARVGLVVNINGSPFEQRKDVTRAELLRRRAAEFGAPLVYVNTVGGQDELTFDGDSAVVTPDGRHLLHAPQFRDGVWLADVPVRPAGPDVGDTRSGGGFPVARVDTGRTGPVTPPPSVNVAALTGAPLGGVARPVPPLGQVWEALVVGLRDYVTKNGFRSVVLGLSGGIDSALVATLAAEALGGENVQGVSMPSVYSSEHSRSDAEDQARRLGAPLRTVPIKEMVDAFVTTLRLSGLAEENVQARIRGTTLMAISNAEGHLVLATGNKSEIAVGYSTIYGDAVGGFAPLKDVPKSLVWTLARWRNEVARSRGETLPITPNSIDKPPSAELRPGQLDTDSLPDYDTLDAIIERYVDRDLSVDQIAEDGFDAETVRRTARMIDAAEWKRRQYPPGTKISFKAFGRDRRMPVTNRYRD